MSATEKLAVGALFSALLLIAPGYVLHQAPRFPGSLPGSLLGFAAALLFVLLLAYTLVKRIPPLRRRVRPGAVLSFHVYAGVVGALLGILHSGHAYRSPLGVALVVAMLAVVGSGFVGRYYLLHVGAELKDQRAALEAMQARYAALATVPSAAGVPAGEGSARRLAAAIADLEWAIARRDALKRALSRWTVMHVAAALAMYALLALHAWSGFYYGLRWLAP